LIEIGLVLFVSPLVINALSRLLIWSLERGAQAEMKPVLRAGASESAA
jgi:hypothetical protein